MLDKLAKRSGAAVVCGGGTALEFSTRQPQGVELAEARRERAIIKEWLALPARRRLLTTPNLNKPAA